MTVNKYRKVPVIVQALEFTGDNLEEVTAFVGDISTASECQVIINTLEGNMIAEPGDMIIEGVAGEFYPCKPDIFQQTYELFDEDNQLHQAQLITAEPDDLTRVT